MTENTGQLVATRFLEEIFQKDFDRLARGRIDPRTGMLWSIDLYRDRKPIFTAITKQVGEFEQLVTRPLIIEVTTAFDAGAQAIGYEIVTRWGGMTPPSGFAAEALEIELLALFAGDLDSRCLVDAEDFSHWVARHRFTWPDIETFEHVPIDDEDRSYATLIFASGDEIYHEHVMISREWIDDAQDETDAQRHELCAFIAAEYAKRSPAWRFARMVSGHIDMLMSRLHFSELQKARYRETSLDVIDFNAAARVRRNR